MIFRKPFNLFLITLGSLFLLASISLSTHAVIAEEDAPIVAIPQLENNALGNTKSIADYKGKLIYLDFWASWCGPCRQSFPFLHDLQEEYADSGFIVIAVNVDSTLEPALNFLEKFPTNYPILIDHKNEMSTTYGVQGLPTSFLIDENGTVIYKHLGFKERDKKWITALVKQNLPKS